MSITKPILIIEDNDQNLYLMRFLLEAHGYAVVEAKDGPSGIAQAQMLLPSLILLDIQLPLMDGYAVLKSLRSFAPLQHVSIVAVTSFAMLGDREKCLSAGATDYIEKPINPDNFIDYIRKYIQVS